eukprot:TRINITY_DN9872_c0_g1_i1.p1 TRINITY_DN9872_c0_g1~~TRINITY_DN9872_c0_g1_i1.p1  ORF type:complete len:377 (+),score=68.88 TRINITY_DN9872_c0_g1_i1:158-1132(+)
MDLGTIRSRLCAVPCFYTFLHQFVEDVRLVWHNCFTFNDSKSPIAAMARDLSKLFETMLRDQLDCKVEPNTLEYAKSSGEQGLLVGNRNVTSGTAVQSLKKEAAPPPDTPSNDGICAVCEKTGNLIFCDGPCQRAFHLVCTTMESFPDDERANWYCEDCETTTHQCFMCKKHGVDDIEVFKCSHGACGKFFHLNCVESDPLTVKKSKFGGINRFVCPHHSCANCKKPGDSYAMSKCFRCVNSYHINCMPLESPIPVSASMENFAYRIDASYIICPRHALKEKRNIPSEEQLHLTKGQPRNQLPYQVPDFSEADVQRFCDKDCSL